MKSAWSGSKNWLFFFDLDQKRGEFFLIWIKKHIKYFWSGPKKRAFFLIWTKNWRYFFWSGSKICVFFLIWIKKSRYDFWSGSKKRFFFDLDQKISFFFLVQDQKIFKFGSKIMRSKNDPLFWSMIYQLWIFWEVRSFLFLRVYPHIT